MAFPICDILAKRAQLTPERIAMEELASGQQVSYRQLHQRAGRCAAWLEASGTSAGDRVAILCRNRIEFFELLFACARLGVILVPLNWRMPAAELNQLMADCKATLLIHGEEDAATAAALSTPSIQSVKLDDAGPAGYPRLRDAHQAITSRAFWPEQDTWYLLYTSGTTGMPKAVIQTYGMALANYVNISQAMGLRDSDRTLCFLPLFHTGGINLVTLPALMLGAQVLITPGFDLERTVELLDAGRLDAFFAVPAVYQAISLHPRFDKLQLDKVRVWACGGAPLPDTLFSRFEQRGAIVLNGMGMTETGPTVFLMDADNAHRKIGSVGKPQLLSQVRLVDPNGRDVPPGSTGELWFAGPGITPGYFVGRNTTNRALVDGHWLRSGDLGRQDEEGYYYIVGRLKDMYISGGENVYPAEVENQLAEHPDILEAAVIGIEDEKWGETGCAFVLPRPGHQIPEATELTAFCRQHLAAYKVPRRFIPVDDFPRTAAGKIQKHLLPKPGKSPS